MPNDKAQMPNEIQNPNVKKKVAGPKGESPSPNLTLALSSKWRGESVEGEEDKRAGRGTRDCFVAGAPRNDFVGLPRPDKSGLARTMGVEGKKNKRAGQETRDCTSLAFVMIPP